MKRTNKGFTLIELLVVVSIIGLLSSVILASLKDARIKATNTATVAQVREYQKAFALFYSDNGRYPSRGLLSSNPICLGPIGTTCINPLTGVTITNTASNMGELAILEKNNPNLAQKEGGGWAKIVDAASLSTYIQLTPVKTPLIVISGRPFQGGYYRCTAPSPNECNEASVYWPILSTTGTNTTNGVVYTQRADGSTSITSGSY